MKHRGWVVGCSLALALSCTAVASAQSASAEIAFGLAEPSPSGVRFASIASHGNDAFVAYADWRYGVAGTRLNAGPWVRDPLGIELTLPTQWFVSAGLSPLRTVRADIM